MAEYLNSKETTIDQRYPWRSFEQYKNKSKEYVCFLFFFIDSRDTTSLPCNISRVNKITIIDAIHFKLDLNLSS